jgi:glycosyltransferase involved in cell wall biosynthesis
MNVLHGVEALSRRAGGLPVAVMELAVALTGAAVKSTLIAPPPGLGDGVEIEGAESLPLLGNDSAGWRRLEKRQGDEPFQIIHQHGIWAPMTYRLGRFAVRRGVPLVISPHGMLEPWALRHHVFRKRLAWVLYQYRNLKAAAVLHATSAGEASQFRRLGLPGPVAVIPLGVRPVSPVPLDPAAVTAVKDRRQVLFLSRIHPKKGLALLLEAWAATEVPDWELVIAGIDQGRHQADMETLAARLGLGDRVRFAGPLFGVAKDTAFRRADLFVLPSHSENFGIVVAEALQYGLPVITTTGTPWRHLPAESCGWCVEPAVAALAGALREALALSDEERRAMGRRGLELVERDHRWPRVAAQFGDLYRWAAGVGPRPDCLIGG